LVGATSITILGSILALQKHKPWGYLVNTSGLIAFWVAALMPYLHAHREDGRPIIRNLDDALMVRHVSDSSESGIAQLLGSWSVTKPDGYAGIWTFKADGNVDSESGPCMGTWRVDPNKLQIRVDWRVPGTNLYETFDLRLDPDGATGQSWSGNGVRGHKMRS